MTDTFYALSALDTPKAFLLSFVIGIFFGFSLERAGFGSSRKLAGIFYFKDMTVLKVMFTAVLTAMLGLSYCISFGIVKLESVLLLNTIYWAQIIGGILFGIGFVISGWCPGTAAVGVASGKLDAVIFLIGAIIGSILFNEFFPFIKKLYTAGESGVLFVYDSLGISKASFAFIFTLIAVGCFWGSEYIEKKRSGTGGYFNTCFLKLFSVILILLASVFFILQETVEKKPSTEIKSESQTVLMERKLMESVDAGEDHIEPEEVAELLIHGKPDLLVVDVRPVYEFEKFHIRGAVNIPLPELEQSLDAYKNRGMIVLYSNGMTHPAQARDSLSRFGYKNVYLLTDGLTGFMERCLKPASLRSEPLNGEAVSRINAWRNFFSSKEEPKANIEVAKDLPLKEEKTGLPGLIDTAWLADNLGKKDIRIIDTRQQPAYNSGHIPGSICISVESMRGVVNGIPSMLLPANILISHLSLMGIKPSDTVIIVSDSRIHDATLISMAFNRLGHKNYAILNGGFDKWVTEGRPVDTNLPKFIETDYPLPRQSDDFTVDYSTVLEYSKKGQGIIIDVRPSDYYTGKKSEEARAGHIPGAISRPYTDDIETKDKYTIFKPQDELRKAYESIIPTKDTPVIVHCRTGHQASQTFFLLKYILGYKNVLWYDGGWTEWASRSELPVEKSVK